MNQIGFICAFLLAPFILIINSFILKEAWQKVISFYLAIIFILIILLYLPLKFFYTELIVYKLVARFDGADKSVYSVYESEMISFGSDGSCRYLYLINLAGNFFTSSLTREINNGGSLR